MPALTIDGNATSALSTLSAGASAAAAAELRSPQHELFFAASDLHVHLLCWDDSAVVDNAVELAPDSIELAHFHAMLLFVDALPTPDVTMEHASPGVRQVFEVLSLHADIFCNFCIGFGLLGHMSLGVNQHQPWPPPDELRLTDCDAKLWPAPWPSFYMVVRNSATGHPGRL